MRQAIHFINSKDFASCLNGGNLQKNLLQSLLSSWHYQHVSEIVNLFGCPKGAVRAFPSWLQKLVLVVLEKEGLVSRRPLIRRHFVPYFLPLCIWSPKEKHQRIFGFSLGTETVVVVGFLLLLRSSFSIFANLLKEDSILGDPLLLLLSCDALHTKIDLFCLTKWAGKQKTHRLIHFLRLANTRTASNILSQCHRINPPNKFNFTVFQVKPEWLTLMNSSTYLKTLRLWERYFRRFLNTVIWIFLSACLLGPVCNTCPWLFKPSFTDIQS